MPALPADIGAATRPVTIATWSDPSIKARYPSARDGSKAPDTGYFDAATDGQTVVNARGALLGIERHRFEAVIYEIQWPDPTLGLPARMLIDSDQSVNIAALVSRVAVNLDDETTREELWG